MRHHLPLVALPLLVAALLTTSCSVPQDRAAPAAAAPSASSPATASPGPAPSSQAAGATMTVSGFAYVVPTSVRPGEQVTVVNEDREAHTVTVDGGAVRLSVLPGATAVFTAPTAPGPHPVTCDLHVGMHAVLVVA